MIKGKIVLGLCGVCLVLSSCSRFPNTTVDNSTDLNNHSISTTSMSRETSDIRYLKKELEDGTLSIWYFDTSTPQDTIAIPEEINGKTVSQIGERLFEGNEVQFLHLLQEERDTFFPSCFQLLLQFSSSAAFHFCLFTAEVQSYTPHTAVTSTLLL